MALKRVIAMAASKGYSMKAGPEAEFFLFQTNNGIPTTETHDAAGYFDLSPVDRGEDVRREIVLALEAMGFPVEAAHHEVAPGQHEIDFRYDDVLTTVPPLYRRHSAPRERVLRHHQSAGEFLQAARARLRGADQHRVVGGKPQPARARPGRARYVHPHRAAHARSVVQSVPGAGRDAAVRTRRHRQDDRSRPAHQQEHLRDESPRTAAPQD